MSKAESDSKAEDDRRLRYLDNDAFQDLFIEELGWERPRAHAQTVIVDGASYSLNPVAEYRGVRVWECGQVPDKRTQRGIDVEMKKNSAERLVIFRDATHQQWKWPLSSDSQGRGSSRIITHEHFKGNRTEALLQRLRQIEIGLDESPSVVEVVGRLRRAFDADAVTKSFYSRFSEQHKSLSSLVKGMKGEADRDWYAALLLNRLMFIYFMQRKGFMDSDVEYLRRRLERVRQAQGPNMFFEFYTDFLIPLFHEGLGSPQRPLSDSDMAALIGDIPYVNGGIFSRHPLEVAHKITIPDKAFESIFDLFDSYQWHLDDRPTGQPNEINPDVLGYIFEQFINNKEQGAYYTKEDVTYFMTASTLLPVLLDRLSDATGVNPWIHPTASPDRYIWSSMYHGVDSPFPDHIQADANQFPRPSWGTLAPDAHGLPGEYWWEVDARRKRLATLRETLAAGLVDSSTDAVSSNIDLETLAVDVIDHLDNAGDVRAAWDALSGLKIIDPTCGSGAFLFAAIKILEALYLAILDAADRHDLTARHDGVKQILDAAARHPSREYFVLKHAAINNLYGVDLMNEAVEIARLRLFLKLVSTVDRREDLEPLPDLDFNIKAGNILVGARSAASIAEVATDIFSVSGLDEVEAAAAHIVADYQAFQAATEVGDDAAVAERRMALITAFEEVRDTVDHHYYESSPTASGKYEAWRESHQPFHWFIEFPEVFASQGFDVVVGNPPYVAKRKVGGYKYSGFLTDDAPDIYAPCVERAAQICAPGGRFAMILPISSQFSQDFLTLRTVLDGAYSTLWVSTFSRNPAALFNAGVGVRSTIVVGERGAEEARHFVTKTHRWYEEFRPSLFETLAYTELPERLAKSEGAWSRAVNDGTVALVEAMAHNSRGQLNESVSRRGAYEVGAKSIALYWLSCYADEPPSFELNGTPIPHTAVKGIPFATDRDRMMALAVLSSKVALFWWATHGDDFNVTAGVLTSLPVRLSTLEKKDLDRLEELGRRISKRLPKHVQYTKYAGKWMGNYVLPEMRDLTDEVDVLLARALGYEDHLPDLELFYWSFYKPTGERPGTLRKTPDFSK